MYTDEYPSLKNVILFYEISEESINNILQKCNTTPVKFSKNELIYSPVETAHKLGIILSGKAVVYSADPERKVLLRTLEKSQIFGISNLFSEKDSFSTNIIAKTECVVLFLSSSSVSNMLQENKAFLHNYIEYLSDRIRFLNRKITYFTAGSAERRLCLYLCSLSDNDTLEIKCNMSDLADMLDIGRASLYRAFDTICEDECIKRLSKTKVEILNRSQMLTKYK